jgi:hypothetical protein
MTNQNETKIHAQPGHQEILITREFDAPRELVFVDGRITWLMAGFGEC